MKIVKLCPKKYAELALNKGQIKLGVTRQYADHPNSEIGDEHEIVSDIGIRGPNTLTREDCKKFNLPIVADAIIISSGILRISRPKNKVYMFSCTVFDSEIKQRAKKLGYDAGYIITDLDKFQTLVSSAIIKYIENKTNHPCPSTSPRRDFVKYKPLDYDSLEEFGNQFKDSIRDFNIYFFKEPEYSYQKEYRFIWPLVRSHYEEGSLDRTTFIEPIDDELILTIPEIISILKKVD